MLNLPYDEMIRKLKDATGLDEATLQARVKERMDQLSGLISREGAVHILANELGVQLAPAPLGPLKISQIAPGLRSVETQGKVTRIFAAREFASGERKGKVGSFFLGDETGQIRVTCWNDKADILPSLQEGTIVKVIDTYVRENNGFKELHLNDKSRIILNPEQVVIGEVRSAQRTYQRKPIQQLKDQDLSTEVFGTIVQVYDMKYFERCPSCKKRIRQSDAGFVCAEHGPVSADFGYVFNVILDDGTGTVRLVFFSEQACALLKRTHSDVLATRELPSKLEEFKTELLGEQVIVRGKATKNAMFDRLEFVVQDVVRDVNLDDEIGRLKKELETVS